MRIYGRSLRILSTEFYRDIFSRHQILSSACLPEQCENWIYQLSSRASEHKRMRDSVLSILSKPLVQFFLKSYQDPKKIKESGRALTGTVLGQILDSVRTISESDSAVGRLVQLYDSKRLTSISNYVDPTELSPDASVLHDAYFQLMSDRPSRGENVNYADAHNYAFTYALNNKCYEKSKYFFLLVTSSPVPYRIFDSIKWNEDPIFKAEPSNLLRTSLVRNPIQLLYLSHISPQSPGSSRRLEDAKADLNVLHTSWNAVAKYRRYVEDKNISGSTPVRLPQNKRYMKHFVRFWSFYQDVYRPLAELMAMDSAQEQNRRSLRRIDNADVSGIRLLTDNTLDEFESTNLVQASLNYRSILALFDRLVNLTEAELTKAKKSLREFGSKAIADLDTTGIVIKPDYITVKAQINDEVECVEITARLQQTPDKEGPIYFCADRYSDYCSFWWRTNVDVSEFLKASRHYVRSAARWITDHRETVVLPSDKEYLGIYFYLDRGIKHFRLDEVEHLLTDTPLNDSLLNLCEPHWHIRFLRIGLEYGDLCYDFQPIDAFPQRAGIVTHLRCTGPIGDLIQWTSTKYAQKRVIEKTIKRVFEIQGTKAKPQSGK